MLRAFFIYIYVIIFRNQSSLYDFVLQFKYALKLSDGLYECVCALLSPSSERATVSFQPSTLNKYQRKNEMKGKLTCKEQPVCVIYTSARIRSKL